MIRIVTIAIGSCSPDSIPIITDADSDLAFVGHSEDTQSALELCATMRPDIALMDICDSGIPGLQAVQAIRAENAHIKMLVLSGSDDPEYMRAMLRVGVSGYLLRRVDLTDLVLSIRTVHSGQVVCSSSITHALIQSFLKS
jgi:DNA-binding NarL/FixJ family response regulator